MWRFDGAAAGAIGRALAVRVETLPHPVKFVALVAFEAQRVGGIAVQFDDIVRPRRRRPDADCRYSASPAPAPCRRDKDSASARWPRPGFALAKLSCMAKRRRQASSRMSWLATKASNGIGWFLVHKPPGERKSGMPHSVEMPAPVNGTMRFRGIDKDTKAGNGCLKIGRDHGYM